IERLGTEREVVLAVVRRAADAGLHTQAWQLAWAQTIVLLRHGQWQELMTMHHSVLAACERAGDLIGQSHALHALALGCARSGRVEEAVPLVDRAWLLAERSGDQILQGRICSIRALLADQRGDAAEALHQARRALELHRAAGFRQGEA